MTDSKWSYQDEVNVWAESCFGKEIVADKHERSCRFMEESMELVQACGLSKADVLLLVES